MPQQQLETRPTIRIRTSFMSPPLPSPQTRNELGGAKILITNTSAAEKELRNTDAHPIYAYAIQKTIASIALEKVWLS